ncbi:MAG TPA: hypothetical protein P5268_01650 [Candidatus Marinimicrobia bacterium]|nr:hypothetical protein [Candidatus Neomarinimicrobiota bacterium]HRS50940.1 hypothetical protein [Candidatus Neomarinimicrobiota bacterium]HRU91718.1 hypothetical protein [Candidatus Neomarinimicrobiota bacterium]
MQSTKKMFLIWMFSTIAFAQQAVEVSDVIISDLGNNSLEIRVEVKNTSTKSISELAGSVDIYDKYGNIMEKQVIAIVLNSDIPLRPQNTAASSIIITQRPNMSGKVNFRITNLRYFSEPNVYMICPACGELIPKD